MAIESVHRLVVVALLLVAILVAPAGPARAAVTCAAPAPSETQPGYTVADPWCNTDGTPFVALPGARVFAGISTGAAYRIEVPEQWNGELVLFAHGYRGTGTTVFVDNPALRAHYIGRGFAWAASSYQTNGYDVGQGVRDSHALIALFGSVVGRTARSVYMTGASMGGHVTAVAIEHFRGSFAGAMPYCGVLGDAELFDYFLDANITAAALTSTPLAFPLPPSAAYVAQVRAEMLLLGGASWQPGVRPPALTQAGQQWSAAVERRSGGERPGFDSAFAFWNTVPSPAPLNDLPFLFGLYPGLTGGTIGIAPGNVTSNRFTIYQFDDRWWLTADEWRLNRDVLRVTRTARPSRDLTGIPYIAGDPRIPVLSMHDIGDLFVPFSMEQVYAARAALHGQSRLFVSRAVRAVGHCDFTAAELGRGFDDLVAWVRTGHRPAGDDVLSREVVARPDFGCRFTVGVRATFVAPPCP